MPKGMTSEDSFGRLENLVEEKSDLLEGLIQLLEVKELVQRGELMKEVNKIKEQKNKN
jgi:hypothetical protein